jgi:RimJ/RimL family protein N-acetyltransferase
MNIRRLAASDAEAMYQLRLHALKSEPQSFRESHEELRKVPVAAYAERLGAATDDNFVICAFEGPELIGMVGFYREQALRCRNKGWIWGMFVDQSHRGKGVGRALLSVAVERTGQLPRLTQLRLTVSVTQEAARKLYANSGFHVFGVEPQAMQVNGAFLDEEQMLLPL